jgi:hypothetical protein
MLMLGCQLRPIELDRSSIFQCPGQRAVFVF